MQVEAAAAGRAEPTPLPHERGVAEQRRFYRKNIEAGHIAVCVSTLEHQHLQLVASQIVGVLHPAIVMRT